jgi:hypothetical protein
MRRQTLRVWGNAWGVVQFEESKSARIGWRNINACERAISGRSQRTNDISSGRDELEVLDFFCRTSSASRHRLQLSLGGRFLLKQISQ